MKNLLVIPATLAFAMTLSTGCVEQLSDEGDDEMDLRTPEADLVGDEDGKADGYFDATTLVANGLSSTVRVAAKSPVAPAVNFTVAGNQTFSTTGLRYTLDPRTPNPNNVSGSYFFGAKVWQFQNSQTRVRSKDGFEISFKDVVKAGLIVGRPFTHGVALDVYVPNLRGPGDYIATGTLLMSSKRERLNGPVVDGARFVGSNCTVRIPAASSDRVIRGTFNCAALTGATGNVSVSGTFVAPDTSLRATQVAAKR